MNLLTFIRRRRAEIYLISGIAGMGATVYMTAKSAIAIHDLRKKEIKANPDISKKELAKKTVKFYIGPVVMFAASAASIGLSYKTMRTRNALLATALASAEAASSEYQKKVVEAIGSEAEQKIRETVKVPKTAENEATEASPYQQYPCIETTTGQTFTCCVNDIRAAQETLDDCRRQSMDNTVCLNDFYQELAAISGAPLRSTDLGDQMGWDVDHRVAVDIDARLVDGVPTINVTPRNYIPLW